MKSEWLKKFERSTYRVKCESCRENIKPEQVPFVAGLCAHCWRGDQACLNWATWWKEIFIKSKEDGNYNISTRSYAGFGIEVVARVFRYAPPNFDRTEAYKAVCYGIKNARRNWQDKDEFEPWRDRLLVAVKVHEAAPIVEKKQGPARKVNIKRLVPKPGQLSLFGGDQWTQSKN